MRPTLRLLKQPGFLKRSLQEIEMQSRRIFRGEYLYHNPVDLPLLSIQEPSIRERIKVMCDQDIGGFSQAKFDIIEKNQSPDSSNSPFADSNITEVSPPSITTAEPNNTTTASAADTHGHEDPSSPSIYGLFHGNISLDLPKNRPDVQRSGYAGFRTLNRPFALFGSRFYDLDMFQYLAFRVRTDGRKYFINIQTDSIVETDLHQHRLFASKPGEWETVMIKLEDFVRTSFGRVSIHQMGMLRQRVKTVGISTTDRVPGPFELAIKNIWATNTDPRDIKDGPQLDVKWEVMGAVHGSPY